MAKAALPEDRGRQRARHIVAAFDGSYGELAAAFAAAAETLREDAEAFATARTKGWQSLSKELTMSAARVDVLVADLAALAGEPAPLREPVELGHATNGDLVYRDPAETEPTREETSLTPIDGVFPDQAPEPVAPSEEAMAYLRGDTDDPLGWLGPEPEPAPDLNKEAQAMTQTFPMAFLDPESRSGRPSVPTPDGWSKHRRSVADLMVPTRAAHTHWSWSQLTTAEDCGVRYRLQRLDDVPQVPQWANIGGTTFHLVGEAFDRAALEHGGADKLKPITKEASASMWEYTFAQEIKRVADESGLPMGDEGQHWRASRAGAENYTWWLTMGVDFVFNYVQTRQRFDRVARERGDGGLPRKPLRLVTGEPVIEWAYEHTVGGPLGDLLVKGVIDRAYVEPDGTIMIEDLKTGRTDPESGQLGEYAYALLGVVPETPNLRILGRFWDARKFIYSNPVDLLAEHPYDEYVYRYHAAEAYRRNGIYSPRKSPFCGGCSVRYACPIGG